MMEYNIIGKNRRTYPRENALGGGVARDRMSTVTVVLVAGEIGDYAAYIGIGEPEFVARHGDKLSFTEACEHFPGGQLKEDLYRV